MISSEKNKFIEYIIVILCIFCSGAVAFQNNNIKYLLLSLLIVGITYMFKKNILKLKINFNFILFILTYLLSLFFSATNGNNIVGGLGILVFFILSMLISYTIEAKSFFSKFNKVISLLSIISLIFYIIPFINPEFPNFFSIIQDAAKTRFRNAYFYCYPLYIGNDYRNQSIFWEPGAFQAFVNLALYIEMYILKNDKNVKIRHLIIYIVTIITTRSTTGYIIMLAIILMNFISKHKISKRSIAIFIVVCLISFPFANNYISIITDKFDSSSNNYVSYERRKFDYSIDIKILNSNFKNFVMGIGEDKYIIQFTNLLNSTGKYSSLSASSSNSVTAFLAQHGIISSISLFSVYLSGIFSIKEKKERYLFLIMIMIILFTENFIVSPVFLVTVMKLLEYKKQVVI